MRISWHVVPELTASRNGVNHQQSGSCINCTNQNGHTVNALTKTVNGCFESKDLNWLHHIFEIWEHSNHGHVLWNIHLNRNQSGKTICLHGNSVCESWKGVIWSMYPGTAQPHIHTGIAWHTHAKDSVMWPFITRIDVGQLGPTCDKKAKQITAGTESARPLSNGHKKPAIPTVYCILVGILHWWIPSLSR